ncbi:MAG: neutral zinc metallopeptidase [Chloroflexia bacterium]|nr:neutral zinc metallopeptidase [Chloroflexia bacterium]
MAAPGESGTGNEATFAAGFFEADIDAYWSQIFASEGLGYWTPAVISMTDAVNSGCGYVTADQFLAFYCSVDAAVYWSVSGYERAYARAGDAAWVNVMAHEWSHHVQLLIGLNTPWRQANDSVGLELEATCLGGAYVADARDRGLVDDDMIALMVQMFGGSETHGTTDQVRTAFRDGIDDGIAACGVAL